MKLWVFHGALAFGLGGLPSQAVGQSESSQRDAAQDAYVAGDFELAERLLGELVTANPADADLLRRLAAVLAARQKLIAAQSTIDRAILLAPDDPDVQLAHANILFWRGRLAEAQAQADKIAVNHPSYPGLSDLLKSLRRARTNRRFRIRSLGAGVSVSDANFKYGSAQIWYVQRGSISTQWGRGSILAVDLEREERATTNTRLTARVDIPEGPNRYFVSASITPEPDFRETWSVGGGADFRLGEP